MSLAQGFPSTFSDTQKTNEVLHNLDNETKKIYNDVNAIMAADGHSHTGNGSDGSKIDYNNLVGAPDVAIPSVAVHLENPITITSALGILTLLETSNSFIAEGTEAITSITGWTKGTVTIRWNAARTLTYNATSLILQNAIDRTTAIGDIGIYEMTSAGTREVGYFPCIETNTSLQGSFKNLKIKNISSINFTGNTTASSLTVLSISSTAGLVVGMVVFGPGITAGTTITAISSGQITLSAVATITATTVALSAGYGNTQTNITADIVTLSNGVISKNIQNVNCTLNTVTTGLNGLDTGTLLASNWYNIFVVYNPKSGVVGCLMSLSATTPTLPTDATYGAYSYFARVGTVRVDSSKYLRRTLQNGNRVQYIVTPNTNTANYPIMASGIQGTLATPVFVPISISDFIPPVANYITGSGVTTGGGSALVVAPNNKCGAFSDTSNPPMFYVYNNVTTVYHSLLFNFIIESSNIYYIGTTNNCRCLCIGWEEYR